MIAKTIRKHRFKETEPLNLLSVGILKNSIAVKIALLVVSNLAFKTIDNLANCSESTLINFKEHTHLVKAADIAVVVHNAADEIGCCLSATTPRDESYYTINS